MFGSHSFRVTDSYDEAPGGAAGVTPFNGSHVWTLGANTMPAARYLGAAAHASSGGNTYAYHIGGTSELNSVYKTLVNTTSGDVGSWSSETNYPLGIHYEAAASSGGDYFFVTGGYSGGAVASVYKGSINGSGVVTWAAQTALNTARYAHGCVIVGNYIYAIGGSGLSSVEYADISGGSISSWSSTTSLPANRDDLACVTYNGRIYVVGGSNGVTPQSTIYVATPGVGGSISSWTTLGTSLPTGRYALCGGVLTGSGNAYLYAIGGYDGSSYLTDNRVFQIQTDGTLSASTAGTARPEATTNPGYFTLNNRVYTIGGHTGTAASNKTYFLSPA